MPYSAKRIFFSFPPSYQMTPLLEKKEKEVMKVRDHESGENPA